MSPLHGCANVILLSVMAFWERTEQINKWMEIYRDGVLRDKYIINKLDFSILSCEKNVAKNTIINYRLTLQLFFHDYTIS